MGSTGPPESSEFQPPTSNLQPPITCPHRILVIRLDRLGDVILSTPVLTALREAYPHAVIAMMVRPACRDVVEGHPALNEVILYEKEGAHKSPWGTLRFAWGLRRRHFDTALVLHPSQRSHWIPWLAGIPARIGYDRKGGWRLTHRVPHRKQEGNQHEAAYTLELLRVLGLTPPRPAPVIRVQDQAARRVQQLLAQAGVGRDEILLAVHPSASCVSKRWMPERFAQVADRLIAERGLRVCLVAGPDDAVYVKRMAQAMRQPALDFSSRLSVAELAALLSRCRLLISNDSGPVHIAAAVGTPVVDLFGRNQRGLSPLRWGPLGEGHVILHKEVGCVTCLAHECDIDFLCLSSITVEEVYAAACSILSHGADLSGHHR